MKFRIVCLKHDDADVIVADVDVARSDLVMPGTLDSDGTWEINDGDLYCNYDTKMYNGFEGHFFVIRKV